MNVTENKEDMLLQKVEFVIIDVIALHHRMKLHFLSHPLGVD